MRIRSNCMLALILASACATTAAVKPAAPSEPGTVVQCASPEAARLPSPEKPPDPAAALDLVRSQSRDSCQPTEPPVATEMQIVTEVTYDESTGSVREHRVPLTRYPDTLQFTCNGTHWLRLAYVIDGQSFRETGEPDRIVAANPLSPDSEKQQKLSALEQLQQAKVRRERRQKAWEEWCQHGHACPSPSGKLLLNGAELSAR